MKSSRRSVLGMAVLLMVVGEYADARGPLREARSPNERFVLRIEPGRPGRAGRSCEATLHRQPAEERPARRIWRRALVNDTAPVHAFVRNDGRFVVTLDEYRRGGARHALVIYGANGELLRHFLLQDLLDKGDWKHVRASKHDVSWLKGAQSAFADDADEFVIELDWGRVIRIDLKRLQIIRADEAEGVLVGIPVEVMSALCDHVEGGAEGLIGERPELAELTPVMVPEPDPADPFDYVSWLNESGQIEGPDADPLYQAAMKRAVIGRELKTQPLIDAVREGDTSVLTSPEVIEWVEANLPAIEMFSEASQYPAKGWECTSVDGSMENARISGEAPIIYLGIASAIDGRLLAAEGRPADAANRYLDVLAAASHAGSAFPFDLALASLHTQEMSAESLLDVLADPQADTLDYADLADAVETVYRPSRPFADTAQGLRARFMDTVQRLAEVDPETGAYIIKKDAANEFVGRPWFSVDRWWSTEEFGEALDYEEAVAAGDAAYDEMVEATSLPFAEANERMNRLDERLRKDPTSNPLLRMTAVGFNGFYYAMVKDESLRRATLLVTNLKAHRQQHGGYPETLEAFADRDFVVDPFSGQPFHYRREGGDFLLYSVAENMEDDGGKHNEHGSTNDLRYWPRPD